MFAVEVPFCFFQQQKINLMSTKSFLFTTGILFGKPELCPPNTLSPRMPSCLRGEERALSPKGYLEPPRVHLRSWGTQTSQRVPPKAAQVPSLSCASIPTAMRYPKRNFSRYLTGLGFFRGGDGAIFGFGGGGGGGFFSGRVTVKASSGGWGCRKRGRKWVETCWGRARGLQPRLALPRLLSATYHWRPERGLRCTAEA